MNCQLTPFWAQQISRMSRRLLLHCYIPLPTTEDFRKSISQNADVQWLNSPNATGLPYRSAGPRVASDGDKGGGPSKSC